MPFTIEQVLTWCPRPEPRFGSYPGCQGECDNLWRQLEAEGFSGHPMTLEQQCTFDVATPPVSASTIGSVTGRRQPSQPSQPSQPNASVATSGSAVEGNEPDDDDEESPVPSRSERIWLKLGVELEGGWNGSHDALTAKARRFGASHTGDGSVRVPGCSFNSEVATKPYKNLGSLLKCIDALYPDGVNQTCGMHVHVSFPEHVYSKLMSEHFYFYFLLRWEAWGKRLNIRNSNFWSRLRGENSYCARKFVPEKQVAAAGKSGDRYAHLNYCYSHLGTIECRLLPMFQEKGISAKAIRELISIYQDYIAEFGDGTEAPEAVIGSIDAPSLEPEEINLEGEIVSEMDLMMEPVVAEIVVDPRRFHREPGIHKFLTIDNGHNGGYDHDDQISTYHNTIVGLMTEAGRAA